MLKAPPRGAGALLAGAWPRSMPHCANAAIDAASFQSAKLPIKPPRAPRLRGMPISASLMLFKHQLPMPFDHRHLRTFVAVAEELSFRRAASRVGLVQPAVSRTIRDLERRLGVRLLSRSTRLVRLTEPGRVFLEHARELLAEMSNAERLARAVDAGTEGRLVVAYMDFAVHRLLPAVLSRFKTAQPKIRVDLIYMWTERQRQAILEREADIGFMIGPFGGPELNSVVVAREPVYAVLPKAHRLGERETLSLRDLADEPFVFGVGLEWGAFHRILADMFGEAGVSPRVVQEASTPAALFSMVGAAMGISLYAGVPDRYSMADVILRPVAWPHREVPICMVWRVGHRQPLLDRFVEVARSVTGRHQLIGPAAAACGGASRSRPGS